MDSCDTTGGEHVVAGRTSPFALGADVLDALSGAVDETQSGDLVDGLAA